MDVRHKSAYIRGLLLALLSGFRGLTIVYRLDWSRRFWRQLNGLFQLRHHLRNRPLELRIFTRDYRLWIVIHLDVGIDAVTFDNPLTSLIRKPKLGNVHRSAVNQLTPIRDANHTAPRAFANELPKPCFAKHGRENIAIRRGVLIQQCDH